MLYYINRCQQSKVKSNICTIKKQRNQLLTKDNNNLVTILGDNEKFIEYSFSKRECIL